MGNEGAGVICSVEIEELVTGCDFRAAEFVLAASRTISHFWTVSVRQINRP